MIKENNYISTDMAKKNRVGERDGKQFISGPDSDPDLSGSEIVCRIQDNFWVFEERWDEYSSTWKFKLDPDPSYSEAGSGSAPLQFADRVEHSVVQQFLIVAIVMQYPS